MAESKRTFQAARMDKDIDDRILKSGQYRDGLNISVDTSEDANVGAIENLKGNELILNQDIYGLSASSNPNATVVGSYPHPEEQKIYYFVTGDAADGIFEYDIINNTVKTIIIETSGGGSAGGGAGKGDAESLEPLTCEIANPSVFIGQSGHVVAKMDIDGKVQPLRTKFDASTSASSISRDLEVRVTADGYSNASIICPVSGTQFGKTAPEVFTGDATDITNTTAQIQGRLSDYNSIGVTEAGFKYGYHTNGRVLTLTELQGSSGGDITVFSASTTSNISSPFAKDISSLVANKLISYVAFAENSIGTRYGEVKTFTTLNTIHKITGLGFLEDSIGNAGGEALFEVIGLEGAEYSFSTADSAVTVPTGTFQLNSEGKNTHRITIGAQATGAAARTLTVTVDEEGTSTFISTSINDFDTIVQAAGADQQYTYTLNPIVTSLQNASLKTIAGADYTGFAVTTTNPGPNNYTTSTTFRVYPDAGRQFSDITDSDREALITGLPTWATLDVNPPVVTERDGDNNDSFLEIKINISIAPDTNDLTETYNVTANANQVKSTWTKGLFSATAESVDISPVEGTKPFIYTGTTQGTNQDPKNITVSDGVHEIIEPTVTENVLTGGAAYVSYIDDLTAGGGDNEVAINFTIDPDDAQRRNIVYAEPAISLNFASREKSFTHTLNLTEAGDTTGEFSIKDSASVDTSYNPTGNTITNIIKNLVQGAQQENVSVYVWPSAGQEFTNADQQLTLGSLPNWVTGGTKTLVQETNYTYIKVDFTIIPQLADVTGEVTFDADPTEVSVTWNRIVDIEGEAKGALDQPDYTLGEDKTVTTSSSPDTFQLSADVLNGASVTEINENKETENEYGGNLITLNSFTPGTLPLENSGTITTDLTANVSSLRRSVNFTEDAPITWTVKGSTPSYTTTIYGIFEPSTLSALGINGQVGLEWLHTSVGVLNFLEPGSRQTPQDPNMREGTFGGFETRVYRKTTYHSPGAYFNEIDGNTNYGFIAQQTGKPGDEFVISMKNTLSQNYGEASTTGGSFNPRSWVVAYDAAGTTSYPTLAADRSAIVSVHLSDYNPKPRHSADKAYYEYSDWYYWPWKTKYARGKGWLFNMKFKILDHNATVYLKADVADYYYQISSSTRQPWANWQPFSTTRITGRHPDYNPVGNRWDSAVDSGVPVLNYNSHVDGVSNYVLGD